MKHSLILICFLLFSVPLFATEGGVKALESLGNLLLGIYNISIGISFFLLIWNLFQPSIKKRIFPTILLILSGLIEIPFARDHYSIQEEHTFLYLPIFFCLFLLILLPYLKKLNYFGIVLPIIFIHFCLQSWYAYSIFESWEYSNLYPEPNWPLWLEIIIAIVASIYFFFQFKKRNLAKIVILEAFISGILIAVGIQGLYLFLFLHEKSILYHNTFYLISVTEIIMITSCFIALLVFSYIGQKAKND